jgi:hypothetical protein
MSGTTLGTLLLGHRVRLASRPAGLSTDQGRIVTVYLDAEGTHYVVLVEGRPVNVADGGQLTVLPEGDW